MRKIPKVPTGTIASRNPFVSGAILFISALGGIAGARATNRWINKTVPRLSEKISLGVTTAQAVSSMVGDNDDDDA